MLVCQTCSRRILRPAGDVFEGVSHGLCVDCFADSFEDASRQTLPSVASNDLERLPMGAILLDDELRVVGFNQAETRTTGLAADKVLGRHFFHEIAPCMDGPEIGHWCAEHVQREETSRRDIDWVLTLRDGKRVAELKLIAGRGRVAITISLYPLEVGTEPVG